MVAVGKPDCSGGLLVAVSALLAATFDMSWVGELLCEATQLVHHALYTRYDANSAVGLCCRIGAPYIRANG